LGGEYAVGDGMFFYPIPTSEQAWEGVHPYFNILRHLLTVLHVVLDADERLNSNLADGPPVSNYHTSECAGHHLPLRAHINGSYRTSTL
jgi:hypothetical protein